jgi:hypothetical protein
LRVWKTQMQQGLYNVNYNYICNNKKGHRTRNP